MKTCIRIAAVLASLFCFGGGFWILSKAGFNKEDALAMGIGLYFVGKAFFVGPMLWVAGEQLGSRTNMK